MRCHRKRAFDERCGAEERPLKCALPVKLRTQAFHVLRQIEFAVEEGESAPALTVFQMHTC